MPSLKEVLLTLSPKQLRSITLSYEVDPNRLRGVSTKEGLAQFLQQEMGRFQVVPHAISHCSIRHLRFLQICIKVLQDEIVPRSALLAEMGGVEMEGVLDETLAEVENLGLAFRTERGGYMPTFVSQAVPVSLSERYRLDKCLNNYDAPTTKIIARKLQLPLVKDTKTNAIAEIQKYLLRPQILGLIQPPLSEAEEDILDYVILSGGAAPAAEIADTFLEDARGFFFRYDWQKDWQQGNEKNALDSLMARGLLYQTWSGYGYNLQLLVPGDLLECFTSQDKSDFWRKPAPRVVALEDEPENHGYNPRLLRDTTCLLGFITAQEAAQTNAGSIHRNFIKSFVKATPNLSEFYGLFLYTLCRDAGLIEATGTKKVYHLTQKGLSWLHWGRGTQHRVLFEAWRNGIGWFEALQEPMTSSNEFGKGPALHLRECAMEALQRLDENRFGDVASVMEVLLYEHPFLLAQDEVLPGQLVSSPYTFLIQLVQGSLYWLGCVELGFDAPDSAGMTEKKLPSRITQIMDEDAEEEDEDNSPRLSYRWTLEGEMLLKGKEPYGGGEEPPQEKDFILQANGEILLTPYLHAATLYRLLALTETPKDGTGSAVSITRDSLRKALDKGETVETILAFLREGSRVPLPQNIEYLINEVGGKHGNIRVGKAQMYVQVSSPLLLQELQARKEMKPYFVRALSDTIALLQGEDLNKVIRDLRKAGYMPVADDDSSTAKAKESGFKVSAPPAPKPIATLLKDTKREEALDKAINWTLLEKSEIKSPETVRKQATVANAKSLPRSLQPPSGAQTNQAMIRFLLTQGVRQGSQYEIVYQTPETGVTTRIKIFPTRVTDEYVTALNEETLVEEVYFFPHIFWAHKIA